MSKKKSEATEPTKAYQSLITRKNKPNTKTGGHGDFLTRQGYKHTEIMEGEVVVKEVKDGKDIIEVRPTVREIECSELQSLGVIDITDPKDKKTLEVFKKVIKDGALINYAGTSIKYTKLNGEVKEQPANTACGHVDRLVMKGLSALFAKASADSARPAPSKPAYSEDDLKS